MEQYLQVGIISSTHGVRGEVKVFPTTDDAGRFKKLKEVLLSLPSGEKLPLRIEQVKFFKQFVILKFKEYDSINDIERYRGLSLYVSRENAVKLEADEYFIADLIDLKVLDEAGEQIGVLTDVMETGANDVYVIRRTDGSELLLPAIKQCVLSVSVEEGQMTVHVPEGL
ncbi:MAG: 16S rRNA processing protein RimM [Lachnospiraceae bacterium]|nr:16S rRNA processing protein RimM [Lachnospiraceae bacterium]